MGGTGEAGKKRCHFSSMSPTAATAKEQPLTSLPDEKKDNLELRVKVAIEGEANAQQRLTAAEAEIAELRQKLKMSERLAQGFGLYFQQTIGQAYGDIQTPNQQLLQQITERDDYNVKDDLLNRVFRSINIWKAENCANCKASTAE